MQEKNVKTPFNQTQKQAVFIERTQQQVLDYIGDVCRELKANKTYEIGAFARVTQIFQDHRMEISVNDVENPDLPNKEGSKEGE